jgi:hypothetical protein
MTRGPNVVAAPLAQAQLGHGSEWPGSHKKDSTYLSEEARNRVRRLRIIYRDR